MAKVRITEELCKGCEICVHACRRGLIKPAGKINRRGYRTVVMESPDACDGCGACSLMCPDMAIEVFQDK